MPDAPTSIVPAPSSSAPTAPITIVPTASAFSGMTLVVATSGDDADPSFDGNYQHVGSSWAGEVWAQVGSTITVEGLAILGAGAAFINYFADGGPDLWILGSSSDWGATSPNEYMIQDGGASALTPANVVGWVHSNDLDIEGTTVTLASNAPGSIVDIILIDPPSPNSIIAPADSSAPTAPNTIIP
jgi:hypothetical protein